MPLEYMIPTNMKAPTQTQDATSVGGSAQDMYAAPQGLQPLALCTQPSVSQQQLGGPQPLASAP
jgi:hypothetical protein